MARTRILVCVTFLVSFGISTWYFKYNPIWILYLGITEYYYNCLNIISWDNSELSSTRIFTVDSLRRYDGSEGSFGLCLAFLGRVYDVSGKGDKFYAPDEGYSFFSGRDATRAFITGEFNEQGLKDDVHGFNLVQMGEVMEWMNFYDKEYVLVGYLQGRYYDDTGRPTEERQRIDTVFKEVIDTRKAQEEEKIRYPHCDIKLQENGKTATLACVKLRSVDRADSPPTRFPRKYSKPGVAGWQCACVETNYLESDNLTEFKGCDQQARECLVSDFDGYYN